MNGVKNIFKKAQGGLRASGQAETFGEFAQNKENTLKMS